MTKKHLTIKPPIPYANSFLPAENPEQRSNNQGNSGKKEENLIVEVKGVNSNSEALTDAITRLLKGRTQARTNLGEIKSEKIHQAFVTVTSKYIDTNKNRQDYMILDGIIK